jgi:hypothetical protein
MPEPKTETVWLVHVDAWKDDGVPRLVSFAVRRTPKQIKVIAPSDTVRNALGWRTVFTPDDRHMRGTSPEVAVAQWRERLDGKITEHEKVLAKLRKLLEHEPVEST